MVALISDNMQLQNNRSVINSMDFINKVRNIQLLPTYKLASFDIVNLYTNIPVNQTLDILYNNLIKSNKLDAQSMNELICILRVILQQNYFTFNGRYYIQRDGLAMGSPCLLYTSRCV